MFAWRITLDACIQHSVHSEGGADMIIAPSSKDEIISLASMFEIKRMPIMHKGHICLSRANFI